MYILDKTSLNPQQYEAVTHREGPMLVLAGAGSGKTRVITHRIAYMISQGVAPRKIVAVSFTNKAASEMRQRVAELVGHRQARRCKLSTFHALGADILRRDIEHLGYRTPFAIFDVADQRSVMRDVVAELRLAGTRSDPSSMLRMVSRAKMALTRPSKLPGMRFDPRRRIVDKVYDRYDAAMRALNAVDFDDLITLPVRLFEEHPDVLARYHRRWVHLMVDEYQDTNHTQFALLNALAAKHQNVVVVGDDDQSIYAFRGAVSDHILHFEEHFPGAKVVALEQNYRSSGIILEAANAVIAQNKKRMEKALWSAGDRGEKLRYYLCRDEREEAAVVADMLSNLRYERQLRWSDIAILYRTNPQSRPFEEALRVRNVPYRIIGGTNFYDRTEVREVVFYLRAIHNLRDDLAVRRIVNVPRRGIGSTLMERIDNLARDEDITFFEAMKRAPAEVEFPVQKTLERLGELVETLEAFHRKLDAKDASPSKIARELLAEVKYLEHLQSIGGSEKRARARVDNVLELVDALAAWETQGVTGKLGPFLERIALEPGAAQADEEDEEDAVVLMTLHSSKGLEFPAVFMVGCEDGLLPHERSINERGGLAEERRLFYVGITRAKRWLTLTSCSQRTRRGESRDCTPSRFLEDIPDDTIVSSTQEGSAARAELRDQQKKRDRKHLDALKAAIFGDE